MSENSSPIWHSPAWITAMVAVVSAFLTIPDIVGNYFSKQQEIELQKEKTRAAAIGNEAAKQKQEFEIVNNTLAQQGTERVFVLRYLARTLDDSDARGWADAEVVRLDKLTNQEEELRKTKQALAAKEAELKSKTASGQEASNQRATLEQLRAELRIKESELLAAREGAGFATSSERVLYVVSIEGNPASDNPGVQFSMQVDYPSGRFHCDFREANDVCLAYFDSKVPLRFGFSTDYGSIHKQFKTVRVHKVQIGGSNVTLGSQGEEIPYSCVPDQYVISCREADR